MSYGSFDAEFKRSMNGTKETLKALINKLGGSVSEEKIDEYPNLVDGIEIAGSASDITYDNKDSGLVATDVQSAIDEVYSIQAGSAAGVQVNLDVHTGDKNNPHKVTAEQVGAAIERTGNNSITTLDELLAERPSGFYGVIPPATGMPYSDYWNVIIWADTRVPSNGEYSRTIYASPANKNEVWKLQITNGSNKAWIQLATTDILSSHIDNKSNPHNVTAAQIGAAQTSHTHDTAQIASGILPYERGGTGVASLAQLVMNMFPAKKYEMPSTSYNFAILGPGWSDNGHLDLPTLASLLGVNAALRYQTGTYKGTGETTNILELPVTPKILIIMVQPKTDWSESVQIPLVAICPGHYLTQTSTMSAATMDHLEVVDFGTTVKIKSSYDFASYNDYGNTYTWVALY